MKRSRFTEEQIIGILKEQEAGAATAEVCRRHGISGATFYKWKGKFGRALACFLPSRLAKGIQENEARDVGM